ncbi:MAG: protein kinase [Candidatus Obscuribacterales bacterium]|nr:protein kinase [Candidatus Obscuribacterales bacterium]
MRDINGFIVRAEIPGYQLLHLLGKGSNGFVVKAKQLATERTVAIKFLKHELLDEGQRAKQRMLGEARLLSTISHRNIIQVFGAGLGKRSPYVITEFVDGMTLADLIAKERFITLNRLDLLFRQLCAGPKQLTTFHHSPRPEATKYYGF